MKLKEIIKEQMVDLGLYYPYLHRKFYRLDHNQQQLEFYKAFFSEVKLTFDIGANLGQRSKLFGDLGSDVVCFEPQPYCIRHLKSRFRRDSTYVIDQSALGEHKAKVKMYLSDAHVISTLSTKHRELFGKKVFKSARWDQEIEVDQNTLDWAILKYGKPDFIKIDVEGYELNVLKGLSQPIKYISFEFTPMNTLMEDTIACIIHLNKISPNYQFNFSLGEKLAFQLNEFVCADVLIEDPSFLKAKNFGDVYAFLTS